MTFKGKKSVEICEIGGRQLCWGDFFMLFPLIFALFTPEPTLKRDIFWIQSDQCGHSEWNIAIGSAGEYLSRNRFERAESFSDRPEKGKYRSLKCWNLEYYHPSEVHPHTSAICMHTMFEQAPIFGRHHLHKGLQWQNSWRVRCFPPPLEENGSLQIQQFPPERKWWC